MQAEDMPPSLVTMRNIWKRFPGVIANQGVNLELRRGEVHALLGENGAGKSTLMKILAGLCRPDAGEIYVDGQPAAIRSPEEAIACGIGMVHQHFNLVDELTVAENIHLGWDQTPRHVTNHSLAVRVHAIASDLGYHVDPNARIWQLSVGEQQRVEILKVLARGVRVLILDEPTAVLAPAEVIELFRVLRALATRGQGVILITHKLEEVLQATDRITVLRAGQNVETLPTSACDARTLACLMVGQEVLLHSHARVGAPGPAALEIRDLNALSDRGRPALENVDLAVRRGEILGIAGVAGNGQRELAEVITGLRPVERGKMLLDGLDRTGASPTQLAAAGMGHIPEDRTGMGLFPTLSVTHNAILRQYRQPPIRRGMWLIAAAAEDFAAQLIRRGDVRVPHQRVCVGNLSGGNQQKLLASREIEIAARILVAVHPTRGLDIAAAENVRQSLVDHRNRGVAVLLISEDLDEILLLADRVAVMYGGRIMGLFDAKVADRHDIGLLMGGLSGARAHAGA